MAIDIKLSLQAMDGDRNLLSHLAVLFSEDAPRIAAEFEDAMSRRDSVASRLAIHNLKGLVASFFDKETVSTFEAFEQECAKENWPGLQGASVQIHSDVKNLVAQLKQHKLVA